MVGRQTMRGHRGGTVPDELHDCDGPPAGGTKRSRLTNARSRALSTASSHPSMLQLFWSSKRIYTWVLEAPQALQATPISLESRSPCSPHQSVPSRHTRAKQTPKCAQGATPPSIPPRVPLLNPAAQSPRPASVPLPAAASAGRRRPSPWPPPRSSSSSCGWSAPATS